MSSFRSRSQAFAASIRVCRFGLLAQERVKVGIGIAKRSTDLVKADHEVALLSDAVGHVTDDVLRRIELRFLGEVSDTEARCQPGLAAEAVIETGHDAQQGRFTRAVGADDADLCSRIEREIDAAKDLAIRRIEPTEVSHRENELCNHAIKCDRFSRYQRNVV
jgi:hypothetical protein